MQAELINYLKDFVTEERYNLFLDKIQFRTDYITVVLEDIYQPHNASAVLRTCDCFGIQDVHIIENRNKYKVNPDVALGSFKWLDLIKHNSQDKNTLQTIKDLKKQGYRIVATTPHTNDVLLDDFDLTKGKAALFFGTELQGLSQEMMDNADEFLRIPMYGFTESFNISVSAALVLHNLSERLRKSNINLQLSEDKKNAVLLNWLRNTIKKSENIENQFLRNKKGI
ncbi:MAG: TrmH family RNA methyltransferase [Bacteroidetes bacterium]|nr:MAG: TrmH family RNA methyltransferase [Bacteroidota bacterium]